MMYKETSTRISRSFSKAVYWQVVITAIISGVSLLVAGVNAAISALAGGACVVVGSYAGMLLAQRPNAGTPGAVLIALLKAELAKVLVIAMLLLIIFKYYQGLVPLSLIGGLAGSALASGAGLRAMNNERKE